jgi:hypothetical protein
MQKDNYFGELNTILDVRNLNWDIWTFDIVTILLTQSEI